jgi:predicted nucleic acid-binding protein
MILVDTNVLLDVLEPNSPWQAWSVGQMRNLAKVHTLAINPIIYAELAPSHSSSALLDTKIATMQLAYENIPRAAAFLAGKAFLLYRKKGGTKTSVLGDFFIGAHAQILSCPVLTRDSGRYTTYFPTVPLITP